MSAIHSTNLPVFDLNLMVALEALLDEVSVGRAANRVALSQPAMSHALKRLRTLLGDPLLVRVGHNMQLTTRGQALRRPVKDALARVRDVLASDTFNPALSICTFRLFVADNAGDLLLPPLLHRLQKEAPHISLSVQPVSAGALNWMELASKVDLVIACVTRPFPGFYQQRLFTDRDACAIRRGHPHAHRLRHLPDFLRARHVAVVGREFNEDPVDTWLHEEGYARNVVLTVPHYLQALHAVASSDLIAVLPERLIAACNKNLPVRIARVPIDAGTFDEYLLHPATNHEDLACAWLRGVLLEVGRSLGPLPPHRQS